MAADRTTFSDRMKRIEGGKTSAWTVPGEGLAPPSRHRAGRSLVGGIKAVALAVLAGGASVTLARWLEFRFLDDLLARAAQGGVDLAASLQGGLPALVLALLFCVMSTAVIGLRQPALYALVTGFLTIFLLEAELVALAPQVYAILYPPAWVADMMANAQLVT